MRFEQKLSLKLTQKLVMTPSLQQAIKLLQMTRLELEGVLTQEMVENPVLEEGEETAEEDGEEELNNSDGDGLKEPGGENGEPAESKDEIDHAESMSEIDLDVYFDDYLGGPGQPSSYEEREAVPLENTLTREPDLYDHLLWQLHMCDVSPQQREIAELIIGNLDPDGFLVATPEEIQALASVQRLEPEASAPRAEAVTPAPAVEEDVLVPEPRLIPSLVAEPALVSSPVSEAALAEGLVPDRATVPPGLEPHPAAVESLLADPSVVQELLPVPAPDEGAAPNPVGNTDGDGQVSLEEVDKALRLVRSFDPPGVGCRDLRGSLLLQLESRGEEESMAYDIIRDSWEVFLKRQFPALARAHGVTLAQLEPAIELIRSLETRPGRRFTTERTHYVEPDVAVVKVGDEYVVQLNDDGLPRLRVSRAYRTMLAKMRSDGRQNEAQQFIKEKIRSAIWLIKSLDQRQRTIYKVAESIVRQQREFLDHGIDHLRPMVLRDVAEDIEMHESTVSRVVTNKYIHTPRGLFPMKFFFHSGIDRQYGGDISSLTVKRKIEHMIQGEDTKHPLSDSELMRVLKREGINIARRTVAKYRDELGIPSSTDRKRFF